MNRTLLLVALFTSGCAADGPVFTASPVEAKSDPLIYVYRPCSLAGAAATVHIEFDGAEAEGLKNCGYLQFRAPAGRHRIQKVNKGFQSWGAPEPSVELDTESGQMYFVRYFARAQIVQGTAGPSPVGQQEFALVSSGVGLAEIQALRSSE